MIVSAYRQYLDDTTELLTEAEVRGLLGDRLNALGPFNGNACFKLVDGSYIVVTFHNGSSVERLVPKLNTDNMLVR